MSALDQIDRTLGAFGEVLDWACATLRPVLPAWLSSLGRRAVRQVVDIHPTGGPVERGVMASSLLGQTTMQPRGSTPKPAPVLGVLDPSVQFTITTELSEAAARAGRSAIALRLDQLSPIPLDEAAFAWRRVSPAGAQPVTVEVSIVRRLTLEEAAGQLNDQGQDWMLVGHLSEDGEPALEFKRSQRQPMGLGLKLVLVSAALAAALISWAGRIDQGAMDLRLDQGPLAQAARQAAEDNRKLEGAGIIHQASLDSPRLHDWMQALASLSEEDTAFTGILMSGGEVALERDGVEIASAPASAPEVTVVSAETGEAAP